MSDWRMLVGGWLLMAAGFVMGYAVGYVKGETDR